MHILSSKRSSSLGLLIRNTYLAPGCCSNSHRSQSLAAAYALQRPGLLVNIKRPSYMKDSAMQFTSQPSTQITRNINSTRNRQNSMLASWPKYSDRRVCCNKSSSIGHSDSVREPYITVSRLHLPACCFPDPVRSTTNRIRQESQCSFKWRTASAS